LEFEPRPAAKSLAEIGDPLVPAVSKVLDKGSRDEKYRKRFAKCSCQVVGGEGIPNAAEAAAAKAKTAAS